MKFFSGRRARSVTLVTFMVCALVASAVASDACTASFVTPGFQVHHGRDGETDVNVCSDNVPAGQAHCLALERTDAEASDARPARPGSADVTAPATQSAVLGNGGAYDPYWLQSAYNAPSATAGAGQTVAIVDAFDDPNAEADLSYYRSYFELPACTTANGCFRKVNETGGTIYPTPNSSWSEEISLDLDMVSAMCPLCNILLVEASGYLMADLGTAVNTAVTLGANVVDNSYGVSEFSGEGSYDAAYYHHPGVAIVAASGDSGFGALYPAAFPDVVAVGGTSLVQLTNSGSRDATETAWNLGGSGCSAYEPKPTWQQDAGCSTRTVADVSAVADPNTGVWLYDTYGNPGFSIEGGTSAAAPIVGAMYALAANPASSDTLASYPYNRPSTLNDVTSGANGSCAPSYLCTAGTGYDGPTGLGTPNGTAAFTLGPGSQIVSFVSSPPTTAVVGGAPYAVSATASSDLPVTLSIDATSSSGCTIAGDVVSFSAPIGTCVVNANQAGDSTFSAASQTQQSFAVGAPPSTPGSPVVILSATAATLRWAPPTNDGGSSITNYTITPYGDGVPLPAVMLNGALTDATIAGLTRGQTYIFTVTAQNDIGTSAPSTPSVPVTVAMAPGPVRGVSVVVGNGTATLRWVPPANDGGLPLTSYKLTPFVKSVGPRPPLLFGAGALVATLRGLTNGSSYTFTVAAQNAIGIGVPSTTMRLKIGAPSVPTEASGSWRQHKVIVHWLPSRTGNGAPVSGYGVIPYVGSAAQPERIAQASADALAITGLAPGSVYTFRIVALNSRGTSPGSTPSNSVRIPARSFAIAIRL